MLLIKSLKIHVDNHSKIPIPNPPKKKKKKKATIVFIKKHMQFNQTHTYTHAIKSMPYEE